MSASNTDTGERCDYVSADSVHVIDLEVAIESRGDTPEGVDSHSRLFCSRD